MSKILLLSIRPQYAQRIFSGDKTVELRRTRPRVAAGDLVLVYTSSPRCELTGAFLVESVEAGTIAEIWAKFGKRADVSSDIFQGYFEGADGAFAICIERAWTFDQPVSLKELRRRMAEFHPPQSYRYFSAQTASSLIAMDGKVDSLRPPKASDQRVHVIQKPNRQAKRSRDMEK